MAQKNFLFYEKYNGAVMLGTHQAAFLRLKDIVTVVYLKNGSLIIEPDEGYLNAPIQHEGDFPEAVPT